MYTDETHLLFFLQLTFNEKLWIVELVFIRPWNWAFLKYVNKDTIFLKNCLLHLLICNLLVHLFCKLLAILGWLSKNVINVFFMRECYQDVDRYLVSCLFTWMDITLSFMRKNINNFHNVINVKYTTKGINYKTIRLD